MKRYIRFLTPEVPAGSSRAARWGRVVGDTVHELVGAPFDGERRTGGTVPYDAVRALAPSEPSKVLAVGRNFRSHLHGREAPAEPGLFAKMPTSIIGPGEEIVLPEDATEVHAEGELVVVIGRRIRRGTLEEARGAIFGVTAGNDVSERRWQREDLQWLRAKGSDTFGPLGPAIVADVDYDDLGLETRINGETVQAERSSDLIFPPAEIVRHASRYVTLVPGDVIYTGTPGTTRAIGPGDRVEVEVEGVGILENRVAG